MEERSSFSVLIAFDRGAGGSGRPRYLPLPWMAMFWWIHYSSIGEPSLHRLTHEAWSERVDGTLGRHIVHFLGRGTFLRNKRAAGRPRDLADIDALEPGSSE